MAVGVALLPVLLAEFAAMAPVDDGGSVPVAGDCADEVTPVVLLDVLVVALLDVLVDGDGVGDVLAELGELLGDDVGPVLSVSHCQIVGLEFTFPVTTPPLGDAARVCGAIAAITTNPVAVVSKTLPALRPIDAGRTRAKHM